MTKAIITIPLASFQLRENRGHSLANRKQNKLIYFLNKIIQPHALQC